MKITIKTLLIITGSALLLASCKKDKVDATQTFTLNLTGLEDLGANARYEGWIMVNGTRNSNSLSLPSGQTHTAFTYHGVKSVRKCCHKIFKLC